MIAMYATVIVFASVIVIWLYCWFFLPVPKPSKHKWGGPR